MLGSPADKTRQWSEVHAVPLIATKWIILDALNMCGWDNMSVAAYISLDIP